MADKQYSWSDGYRAKVDAGEAGLVLRALEEKHGKITADLVLKEAKKKKSPLHDAFNWDDVSAANEHRLEQARTLIRHLRVTVIKGKEPVRVYAHVTTKDAGPRYVPTSKMTEEEYYAAGLRAAKAYLTAARKRFAQFKELRMIWAEVDGWEEEAE